MTVVNEYEFYMTLQICKWLYTITVRFETAISLTELRKVY
jgi:hypothetical protein